MRDVVCTTQLRQAIIARIALTRAIISAPIQQKTLGTVVRRRSSALVPQVDALLITHSTILGTNFAPMK
jgi:hypothetical protein